MSLNTQHSILNTPPLPLIAVTAGEPAGIGPDLCVMLARHTVPAVGFAVCGETACLAFSGDTTTNPEFWAAVCALPGLRHVIVETAFPDAQIIVYGHTHKPLLTIVDVVVTVMNPGGAGHRRFGLPPSVGILELEPGIPPRGRVLPLLDFEPA